MQVLVLVANHCDRTVSIFLWDVRSWPRCKPAKYLADEDPHEVMLIDAADNHVERHLRGMGPVVLECTDLVGLDDWVG